MKNGQGQEKASQAGVDAFARNILDQMHAYMNSYPDYPHWIVPEALIRAGAELLRLESGSISDSVRELRRLADEIEKTGKTLPGSLLTDNLDKP